MSEIPFDVKRQRAPYKFEGTDKQATAIIEIAEKEFEQYKGRQVFVNAAEVHTVEGDFGDHNFDPPLSLTVLDLEIVEEDWTFDGLFPCWEVSPPPDSPTDTFYVFGTQINTDGSRGDLEESYWTPLDTYTSPDVG